MAMQHVYESGSNRSLSAMFDTRAEADRAVSRLREVGIADVVLTGEDNPGYGATSRVDTTRDEDRGFFESIGDFFFPEEDRHTYAEGLNRGGFLVTVSNVPAELYDRALDILDDEGAIDLDARESEWRAEGWAGVQTLGSERADAGRLDATGDDHIDVVEERMSVAKRETDAGRVRVRSYVREVPVEQEVELRSESVNIERHPVDRPAGADAFEERSIEAREYRESAVVQKDARVVEEIDVHKDVESHTETVRDTVRKTEVEIEDDRGTVDPTIDRGVTGRDDVNR